MRFVKSLIIALLIFNGNTCLKAQVAQIPFEFSNNSRYANRQFCELKELAFCHFWPPLPHVPHVPHASLFTLSLYITFWIEPKRIKIQGVRNMRKLYLCFVKFQRPNCPLFLHWCPAVHYKSNPFHRRWVYTFPQSFVLFTLRNVRL